MIASIKSALLWWIRRTVKGGIRHQVYSPVIACYAYILPIKHLKKSKLFFMILQQDESQVTHIARLSPPVSYIVSLKKQQVFSGNKGNSHIQRVIVCQASKASIYSQNQGNKGREAIKQFRVIFIYGVASIQGIKIVTYIVSLASSPSIPNYSLFKQLIQCGQLY